jgi:hypothetical protein
LAFSLARAFAFFLWPLLLPLLLASGRERSVTAAAAAAAATAISAALFSVHIPCSLNKCIRALQSLFDNRISFLYTNV